MSAHIFYDDPYGGAGLRARSVPRAYEKVRAFLDQVAESHTLRYTRLDVADPAGSAMKHELRENVGPGTPSESPAALVERIAHALGDTARAAWDTLGEPTGHGWLTDEPEPWLSWYWEEGTYILHARDARSSEPSPRAATLHPAHAEFLHAHCDETYLRGKSPWAKVALHAHWTFRVSPALSAGREVEGTIRPHFANHGSSFFFDFNWPGQSIDAEFVRFYDAVADTLVKLPESRFKIWPGKGRACQANFKRKDWP